VSSTVFYVGGAEFATVSNVFAVNGAPADPTTVSLTVTDPAGVTTTYTYNPGSVTRTGTGAYQELVACATPGLWQYVWIGTGAASDVAMGTWTVFPLQAGQWYTSKEEVKSRLGIDPSDDSDDFEIELAVQAAAGAVNRHCGRHFYQVAETRTFVPDSVWTAHVDDIVSVSALDTDTNGDGTFPLSWTQGVDYELSISPADYNLNAAGEPRPYKVVNVIGGGSKFFPFIWPLYRVDRIRIAGVWGWPATPAVVHMSSLVLATDWFKLKDAPFGVSGSAELGQIRVQPGSEMDAWLQPYIDPTRKVGV
jgi:hypothetical protein